MKHRNIIIPTILILLSIIIITLNNNSVPFTVFYVDNIFPYITLPLSFISGIFPFSVGESLLYLAVLLILIWVIFTFLCIVLFFIKNILRISHKINKESLKHGSSINKFYKTYSLIIYNLIGIYSLIMVLNCFILYRYPSINGINGVSNEDTIRLIALRDYVVTQCNEFSSELSRDRDGNIVMYADSELSAKAIAAMHSLAANGYDRLDGYYPHFKNFINPAFFSQQYIMGYYFPFSMESNINSIMLGINKPHTICHELSHLKGYIREDEANFIAYLACISSDDPLFEYSALLSVINYLDRDFINAINHDETTYYEHPQINETVKKDRRFLTQEQWDWVEANSLLDTETVDRISDMFTDTVLKTNGVLDGMKSYSRVVQLLLQYYGEDIPTIHT